MHFLLASFFRMLPDCLSQYRAYLQISCLQGGTESQYRSGFS